MAAFPLVNPHDRIFGPHKLVPAGVVPDVTPPYGIEILNYGEVQGLHLTIADIYLGTDTTVTPLLTVTGIADLA